MDPAPPVNPAPPPAPRSRMTVLVAGGALLAFALLLVLANFSGRTGSTNATPNTDDPFAGFSKDDAKTGKSKIKAKAKAKAARVDPASLVYHGPPVERPSAPPDAKNLVVVVLTAVRKDALTPYGAPPERTPFLQELASKGARFTDLVSTSPFSRQASVSLLTGRFAAETGTVEPGPNADETALPNDVDTLAEKLQAAGWRTYGVTGNQNLNASAGFAQGFDEYQNAPPNGFTPGSRMEGDKVVPAALAMLAKRSPEEAARPFYLQVDLIDAHAPLKVLKEVEQRFQPDQPNAPYRVAVYNDDQFVASLLRGIEDQGHSIGKDTYVVVVTDHGEGNEDPPHHGKMHGFNLYETIMDAPWIVAGPDVPANRLIGGLASGVDVMPTALGLVGIQPPAGIDGQSWAAEVKGKGDKTTRDRAFSDTWFLGAARAAIWTDALECQKDYGSVGLKDTFADGCYDRRTDPQFTNLKTDAALQGELDAWRAKVTNDLKPNRPAPAAAAPAPASQDDDGQAEEPQAG